MGKWTPAYTDDVLHSKISTLVSGAIRRVAVERETTTSITYENFVNDLDTGDSFTASLIDILVKEIADRRLRTHLPDRSLLGERTVRSLRTLVSTSRVYSTRFRSHARRSVVNIPEYLSVPPPPELDLMDEDDDEFEVEVPAAMEGTRMPSDLHDAYSSAIPASWALPAISTRRFRTSSPTPSDGWQPTVRSPSVTATTRPWYSNPPAASQGFLSRQASIRRAARTRVDYNESSQRRRWSTRESALSPRPDAPESVTEPRDGLVWNRPLSSGRRFFPLPRARRHDSSSSGGGGGGGGGGMNVNTWTDLADRLSPDTEDSFDRLVAPNTWDEPVLFEPPSPEPPIISPRGLDSRNAFRMPRLRRGGVLPPESMISRHASPVIITPDSAAPSSSSATIPPPVVVLTPPPSDGPTEEVTSTGPVPVSPPRPPLPPLIISEEPVAYPTPGSTTNENLA